MKVAVVIGIVVVALLQERSVSAQTVPTSAPRQAVPAEPLKSETAALLASLLPTLGGSALVVAAAVMKTSEGCSGEYVFDPATNMTTMISGSCRDYGAAVPVSAAVGIAAILVGPTIGHLYAGRAWSTGLKVRLAGIGIALAGVAIAAASSCKELCDQHVTGAMVSVLGGGGTFLVGTIIEIATAPDAVRARNQRIVDARVDVVPLTTGTGTGAGFVVSGRF